MKSPIARNRQINLDALFANIQPAKSPRERDSAGFRARRVARELAQFTLHELSDLRGREFTFRDIELSGQPFDVEVFVGQYA